MRHGSCRLDQQSLWYSFYLLFWCASFFMFVDCVWCIWVRDVYRLCFVLCVNTEYIYVHSPAYVYAFTFMPFTNTKPKGHVESRSRTVELLYPRGLYCPYVLILFFSGTSCLNLPDVKNVGTVVSAYLVIISLSLFSDQPCWRRHEERSSWLAAHL